MPPFILTNLVHHTTRLHIAKYYYVMCTQFLSFVPHFPKANIELPELAARTEKATYCIFIPLIQ